MTLRIIVWAAVSTKVQANEDEKYSLPSQIAAGEAFAKEQGGIIVDTLIVPGHSRNYKSLDKLAADARLKDIDAFDKLIDHLNNCDFDVLWCRDANRFARRASLLHYIVESIIEDCGARIFSANDGWVDATNADIFAMVKGYETSKQMKWLRESSAKGKDKLIERGLPIGAHIPMSHLLIRDKVSGKAKRLVLNKEKLPFMLDLAGLILEGIAWNRLGQAMYDRFGYTDKSGKPYAFNTLYYLIYNPMVWGHMARGHTHKSYGAWVFDKSAKLPEDAVIKRDCIPSVYRGELAEKLKAELYRRMEISGRARPDRTFRFSALCLCGECGRSMVVRSRDGGEQIGIKCPTIDTQRTKSDRRGLTCAQNLMTPKRYLQSYFNDMLEQLLLGETPPAFKPTDEAAELSKAYADVDKQIAKLNREIDRIIEAQATAPANVQGRYRQQMNERAGRLEALENRKRDLQRRIDTGKKATQEQLRTVEEIRSISLEKFWQLEDMKINQLLKRLLGNNRLVILNRQVVKVVEKPQRY